MVPNFVVTSTGWCTSSRKARSTSPTGLTQVTTLPPLRSTARWWCLVLLKLWPRLTTWKLAWRSSASCTPSSWGWTLSTSRWDEDHPHHVYVEIHCRWRIGTCALLRTAKYFHLGTNYTCVWLNCKRWQAINCKSKVVNDKTENQFSDFTWFIFWKVKNKSCVLFQLLSQCILIVLAIMFPKDFTPEAHVALDKFLAAMSLALSEQYRWAARMGDHHGG